MRDIALARLTGAARALPAPVDGGLDRDGAGRAGERRAGHGRGHDPPLHAHPRRVRVVRPGVQGEPAAAHRRRRRRGHGRPRRRTIDAIATDHAPHAQEAKEQPFDQAPPGMLGLETALALALTELELPIEIGARAALVAAGRDRRAHAARTAGRSRRATPQTSASSTRPPSGSSIRPRWRAAAATRPYAGRTLTGRVRHTLLARRTGRDRRRGAAMSGRRSTRGPRHCSSSPTARSFEGEAIGAPAGGVERRGRLQHRAVRLPGGHHRPVVRRADHQLHLSRTSATTARPRSTRRAAGRSAAASSSATSTTGRAAGASTRASTSSSCAPGSPGIAGVDTRRLTRHIRDAGAMPGAFGTASETELLGRGAGRAGHRRHRPRRRR